ncbi:hypothetical protein [Rhizobium leguminosarum]|uniref:hypothetical protein n=1 Tax=Rhizobium leguminosarum TaxID=384 RepID=UPI003F95D673
MQDIGTNRSSECGAVEKGGSAETTGFSQAGEAEVEIGRLFLPCLSFPYRVPGESAKPNASAVKSPGISIQA